MAIVIFNECSELSEQIDALFSFLLFEVGLPVFFGITQPLAIDSPAAVVLDIGRLVFESLGSDFGESQELFEVFQVRVGDVCFEGL